MFENCLQEISGANYRMQASGRRNKKVVCISCKSGKHRSVGLASRFCTDMIVEQGHLRFIQIDLTELTLSEVDRLADFLAHCYEEEYVDGA